jgi:hypothetical protein
MKNTDASCCSTLCMCTRGSLSQPLPQQAGMDAYDVSLRLSICFFALLLLTQRLDTHLRYDDLEDVLDAT